MHWRIKGLVQGALATLPGGNAVNDRLQTLVGGRRDPNRHVDEKFRADWLCMMEVLNSLCFPVQGRTMLEIGTGWTPVLPLCFALAGARQIHSVDLNRHLAPASVPATLRRLQDHLAALAAATRQEETTVRARYDHVIAGRGPVEMLQRAGIHYHAPADARNTELDDASIDLVFSNSVLEHVDAAVLGALMRESRRVVSVDGLVLHSINCGDHYAYADPRITAIHYLRFSARQWRRWNNALLFQNRLRPSDFVAAVAGSGLEIVHRMQTVRQELMAQLHEMPIALEFRHYPAEELCTTSVTLTARHSRATLDPPS
jgi:cyclopropane fatty-acyl-phospholipid synthase-like methyltransferase